MGLLVIRRHLDASVRELALSSALVWISLSVGVSVPYMYSAHSLLAEVG
jgi:hypothetical protein